MCRITGFRDFRTRTDYDPTRVIMNMRDTMIYGGPDDAGSYVNKKFQMALGHRRLTILDLTRAGHQPMCDRTKKVWITYNGEVYNFNEIKKELIKKGITFSSTSDTEVILQSYKQWGMNALEKFRGMFAFVIWDETKEKMILVRDRAGIKPLYYYYHDGVFLFSSELKAFYQFPYFNKQIDYDALAMFLQTGYITSPWSVFKYVKKLAPGTYLEIDKTGHMKTVTYWDVARFYTMPPWEKKEKQIEEELERLMIESFKYRLIADVPVGIFLSGGIDSSAVTALLQKNVKKALKTFTIGFEKKEYNEAAYAERIARRLGCDHTQMVLNMNKAYPILDRIEEIYDEPFGDSSGIPTFLVSQLARQKVKVSLSADGGDELFAGYTKYEIVDKYYRRFSRLPHVLRFFSAQMLELLSPEFVETFYSYLSSFLPLPKYTNVKDKFYKLRNVIREDKLNNIFKKSGHFSTGRDLEKLMLASFQGRKTEHDQAWPEKIDNFSGMQMIDFKTYMPDDILVKVDRASMQNSLEAREPFLDHKLVEYVARIPASLKYKKGISKWILRKILYRYVPKDFLERPKMGFGIPLYVWMRESILRKYQDTFEDSFLQAQGIFHVTHLKNMVQGFKRGGGVNAHFIWFVFVFQRWYKHWIEN
ncbi:MAG: asparagine synthase (glutamine-hydrolyzing) [Spirochaetes bacterium]|nr:asparagine synthase (glutamine-hydrolyzing) [Spirochaetota bacterium]